MDELLELLAQKEVAGAPACSLLLVSLVVVEGHLPVYCDNPHIYSARHS